MKIIIKGTAEWIRACESSDVLEEMIKANYITRFYRPFNPIRGNNKLCGVVRQQRNGEILLTDLSDAQDSVKREVEVAP